MPVVPGEIVPVVLSLMSTSVVPPVGVCVASNDAEYPMKDSLFCTSPRRDMDCAETPELSIQRISAVLGRVMMSIVAMALYRLVWCVKQQGNAPTLEFGVQGIIACVKPARRKRAGAACQECCPR